MSATRLAPRIDLGHELADAAPIQHHPVRAEVFERPALTVHAITQPFPRVDGRGGLAAEEDEAVREPGGPVERDFAISTEPDRDGTRRLWHERGSVDPVETSRE